MGEIRMKKIILTVLFLSICSFAAAGADVIPKQNILSNTKIAKRPKSCFSISIDTLIIPGIRTGYGWITYNSTYAKEEFVIIHVNSIGVSTSAGIFYQKNIFQNLERIGFFMNWNAGLDYLKFKSFINESKPSRLILPYLSIGCGHSFKIGDNSFFRISGDWGIRFLGGNVTLSLIF